MHLAFRTRWCLPACLVGVVVFLPSLRAEQAKLKDLLQQAEYHEQQNEWDKACDVYESILRLDRGAGEVKDRYQNCLRRYWLVRRHRDLSYRKEVLSLDYAQALRLYGMIRDTLLDNALEKKKADPTKLFRRGLEELDNALTDPIFLQQYVSAKPHEVRIFRSFLKKTWGFQDGMTRTQVLKHIREVALAAQNVLQIHSTVVIMEFACGACYALDEYTLYLTPHQLRELCDSLRGEFAGVGLTLRFLDGKMLIGAIDADSPAARLNPPLARDDQIVAIDKKPVSQLTPEAVQEMLEGPIGTMVELEIFSPALGMRIVPLVRRAMFVQSVNGHMKSQSVGYLHVAAFQDTTVKEIDDTLDLLVRSQIKALILDLRGNSGGLFEASIDVARRFLSSGTITSTQNTDPKFNMVYKAQNPNALTWPLVVLIDGDTASAAEVLAGALKYNQRGRLVGQTTFGKGCTQCVLKLPAAPGGIPTGGMRLTVARFFSPDGLPYTGRGVTPHIPVDRFAMSMSGMDLQMQEALQEAQRLLEGPR